MTVFIVRYIFRSPTRRLTAAHAYENGKLRVGTRTRRRDMTVEMACKDMVEGHLVRGLRRLLNVSPKSKRALAQVVHEQSRREVLKYTKSHPFPDLNRQNLDSFNWSVFIGKMALHIPIVYSALSGPLRKINYITYVATF